MYSATYRVTSGLWVLSSPAVLRIVYGEMVRDDLAAG